MKKLILALGLAVHGISYAAITPKALPTDSRIRTINYVPNDVYRITVKKGTVTRIVLGEGERILERGAATGYPSDCEKDDTNWCIFADTGSNLVWVKPKDKATRNNLELRTNKRDYSFDFQVLNNAKEKPMYRVVFKYPQEEEEKRKQEEAQRYNAYAAQLKEESQLTEFLVLQHRLANAAPIPKNWNYRQAANSKGKHFVPEMLFDDGRFTYMRFKGNTDIPVVFIEGTEGEEKVNFHISKEDPKLLIVEALAKKFVLRQGKGVVSIFNESYDPVGVAPQDGTTVDGVKRVITGDMN